MYKIINFLFLFSFTSVSWGMMEESIGGIWDTFDKISIDQDDQGWIHVQSKSSVNNAKKLAKQNKAILSKYDSSKRRADDDFDTNSNEAVIDENFRVDNGSLKQRLDRFLSAHHEKLSTFMKKDKVSIVQNMIEGKINQVGKYLFASIFVRDFEFFSTVISYMNYDDFFYDKKIQCCYGAKDYEFKDKSVRMQFCDGRGSPIPFMLLERKQIHEFKTLVQAFPQFIDAVDAMKQNLVHAAVIQKDVTISEAIDILEFLKNKQANFEHKDRNGRSPLSHAVSFGNDKVAIVQWLLNNGANVRSATHLGYEPIHYVKSAELLDLLIHNGADIFVQPEGSNDTPLFMAIKNNKCGVAQRLFSEYGDQKPKIMSIPITQQKYHQESPLLFPELTDAMRSILKQQNYCYKIRQWTTTKGVERFAVDYTLKK